MQRIIYVVCGVFGHWACSGPMTMARDDPPPTSLQLRVEHPPDADLPTKADLGCSPSSCCAPP